MICIPILWNTQNIGLPCVGSLVYTPKDMLMPNAQKEDVPGLEKGMDDELLPSRSIIASPIKVYKIDRILNT